MVNNQSLSNEERFKILAKQTENIFESPLNKFLTDPNHELSYKRRSNWNEVSYREIPHLFPFLTEKDIIGFTAGPYLLRKAKMSLHHLVNLLKEREEMSLSRQNIQTNTTNSSCNKKVYRTMILKPHKALEFLNIPNVIRVDSPSFFASQKKFISCIGLEKNGDRVKMTFACTCNTGGRYWPCVHNNLNLYLFGNFLKEKN